MKFSIALAILAHAAGLGNATDCPKDGKWDVIVIGAGLSGSIVSAKLSTYKPDKCVLVVEGGKDNGQIVSKAEGADIASSTQNFFENNWETVHEQETMFNTPATYNRYMDECWGAEDHECEYVWGGKNDPDGMPGSWLCVGKIVGGSGSLNGALMQYPPDEQWGPYADYGWTAANMKKYLDEIHIKMEATSTPSTDRRHYNDHLGPEMVKKVMENKGFEYSDDAAYMKPRAGTMGIPKVTTRNGRRISSTSEYLKPALEDKENPNIELWTQTTVTKIVLEESSSTAGNKKATGLKVKKVQENEEVEEVDIYLADDGLLVMSGGGVKTPQLLLESGVGPGLSVDNPSVGKELTDKAIIEHKFKKEGVKFTAYDFDSPPQEDQKKFVNYGQGPLTQFGPLLVGMIDPEIEGDDRHNLVEFFVPPAKYNDTISVFFVHLTPKEGSEQIYFNTDTKKAARAWGPLWDKPYTEKSMKNTLDFFKGAMEDEGYYYSGTENTQINGMNHPGGTCEMGKCMDPETFLVKGLDNVAVCDNSIVPEQAVVHTAFTLMAISLRGADIMKEFWTDDIADRDEL